MTWSVCRLNPTQGRRAALVLLLATSISGCTVGPDYREPGVNLPMKWSDGSAKRVADPAGPSRCWRRLNDPVLDRMIEDAVASNLDVATAKAKVREARASETQAAAALLPSVTGSDSTSWNKSSSNGAVGGAGFGAATYNQFKSGFDSSWELDLFGANRRGLEAAAHGAEAAEEDLYAALLTLIGDVASNYLDARGYQARIELARRTVVSQQQTAALTRSKSEAGSATAVDVAKAGALASSIAANIPTYEAALAADIHRLSILLGREPPAVAPALARPAPVPSPRLPLPKGIPADILLKRPDIRAAERRLAQSTARIGQAEAARYPSVSLTGSVSTSALNVGDLARYSSLGWSIGPSISFPVFNGGKLEAAVEASRAQRDQSFVAFHKVILTGLEDVENSIVSLASERMRVRRLADATYNYREAARLSRLLYQNGTSSFLDVLDSERSLYTSEDSLLQSRVTLAKNYVALAKALGGGWDAAVDSSRPVVADTDMGPRAHALR
jgi:multidrug efflux system outer membrane protein